MSDWNLNPCDWDSNPAKTLGTWFQDLMKLRFLISHLRKNSVRDKVISNKWIYSDSERSTLHRKTVGHHKGWVWPWNIAWLVFISSVQLLNWVRLFVTSWTAAHQASLSITSSQSLPKLMSIELIMPSNHLILCPSHMGSSPQNSWNNPPTC